VTRIPQYAALPVMLEQDYMKKIKETVTVARIAKTRTSDWNLSVTFITP